MPQTQPAVINGVRDPLRDLCGRFLQEPLPDRWSTLLIELEKVEGGARPPPVERPKEVRKMRTN
jgi:hypothetical protein